MSDRLNKPAIPRGAVLGAPACAPSIRFHLPPTDLVDVVRHFWFIDWSIPDGEARDQWVLSRPAVNIGLQAVEQSITGLQTTAQCRRLVGDGWVRGIQFRAAGFGALVGPHVRSFTDTVRTVDALGPRPDWFAALPTFTDAALVDRLSGWIRTQLLDHDPAPRLRAEAVVALAEHNPALLTVRELASAAAMSERSLQRLLGQWVGLSPKGLLRRFRLHEAAHQLTVDPQTDLATLALSLGYADQAHFSRDFRAVVGRPPGNYGRSVIEDRPSRTT